MQVSKVAQAFSRVVDGPELDWVFNATITKRPKRRKAGSPGAGAKIQNV